jgi:hypothetical protein
MRSSARSIFLSLIVILSLLASPPVVFSQAVRHPTYGIMSEIKRLKARDVTVFAQEHGATIVVLVSIGADGISYNEIGISAFDQDGKALGIQPWVPATATVYMGVNGSSIGTYKVVLAAGQQLAGVKIARGDETHTFSLVVPE